jgi:hypothetical protein
MNEDQKIEYRDFMTGKKHFTRGKLIGTRVLENPLGMKVKYYIIRRKSDVLYIPEYLIIPKKKLKKKR